LSRLTCSCVARLHESTFSVWCKEGVFWIRESPDEEKDLWIATSRTWWRCPAAPLA
jgi:hypothetical protein